MLRVAGGFPGRSFACERFRAHAEQDGGTRTRLEAGYPKVALMFPTVGNTPTSRDGSKACGPMPQGERHAGVTFRGASKPAGHR